MSLSATAKPLDAPSLKSKRIKMENQRRLSTHLASLEAPPLMDHTRKPNGRRISPYYVLCFPATNQSDILYANRHQISLNEKRGIREDDAWDHLLRTFALRFPGKNVTIVKTGPREEPFAVTVASNRTLKELGKANDVDEILAVMDYLGTDELPNWYKAVKSR